PASATTIEWIRQANLLTENPSNVDVATDTKVAKVQSKRPPFGHFSRIANPTGIKLPHSYAGNLRKCLFCLDVFCGDHIWAKIPNEYQCAHCNRFCCEDCARLDSGADGSWKDNDARCRALFQCQQCQLAKCLFC